jgi:AraC-like DNA-binding protein
VTDAISAVLQSIRLTGGIFLDARFTAPWCTSAAVAAEDCKPLLAAPAHVIAFHVVIAGSLLAFVGDEPAVEVNAGEIVLLPRNDDHILASASGLPPVSARELLQPATGGGLARISYGGGGPGTHVVCGFLGSDEPSNPLIAKLPRLLKLDVREGTTRDWIEASVRFAAAELAEGRLGSSSVMSRLSESLFIEAVRHYAATLGDRDHGWLRGAGDSQIGRALALIHGDRPRRWSAHALAEQVGMSRSAFMDRFTTLVGVPPVRYLTSWRLGIARRLIGETRKSVAELAHLSGYGSDEAFSRAFKREFGVSPAQCRGQRIGG